VQLAKISRTHRKNGFSHRDVLRRSDVTDRTSFQGSPEAPVSDETRAVIAIGARRKANRNKWTERATSEERRGRFREVKAQWQPAQTC
jgi:hypothetical protein